MEMNEILRAERNQNEEEESIRPQTLDEYIGQDNLKDNLRIFIQANPSPLNCH